MTALESQSLVAATSTSVLTVGGNLILHATTIDRDATLAQSTQSTKGSLGIAVAVSYLNDSTSAFLDGQAGMTYAYLQAIYEYMIVVKTRELERQLEVEPAPPAPSSSL